MKKLLTLLCIIYLITGCSANMAMNGQNGPDLEVVKNELSRLDVERQLGSPVSSINTAGGSYICTYNVQAKTKPNLTRAMAHSTADLFTLGLWEIIGSPIEVSKARRKIVSVTYDSSDRVLKFTSKDEEIALL